LNAALTPEEGDWLTRKSLAIIGNKKAPVLPDPDQELRIK